MLHAASAWLHWGPASLTPYMLQSQLCCRVWVACCTDGVQSHCITAAWLLHPIAWGCAQLP